MADVSIHANPGIGWHKRYAEYFRHGFAKQGIFPRVTSSAQRDGEIAVLFGPNYWKQLERDGDPYIMVNRVLLSTNKQHVHDVVALSWGGFNGRGTFCVDEVDPDRIELFINPAKDIASWRQSGEYLLLCGQADLGRCGKYASLAEWYDYVKGTTGERVVFREHPTRNPRVPLATHFHMARAAAVLNSTVAIDALLAGVPVVSLDEGNPAHAIAGHTLAETLRPERLEFFQYLAHCQYFFHEIQSGLFWERLNPQRGPRLCEWQSTHS